MISCIICSNNGDFLRRIKENIAETIGVEYELIICDDAGKHGICKAYNDGAQKSKYSWLCFLHEDIRILTRGWGSSIISHFTSVDNAGVLGIAGSVYKARMVSGWWQPPVNEIEPKRVNVIQYFKHSQTAKEHSYINPNQEEKSLVVALDGVFLFTSKEVWSKHRFDEDLLHGFHAYDLDFTLHVGTTHKNYVVYDILMEHFSEGVNDITWIKNNVLVHNKWRKILPVIKSADIKKRDLILVDQLWLHQLLSINAASFIERLQIIYSCIPLLRFNILKRSVFLSIYHYIFQKSAA